MREPAEPLAHRRLAGVDGGRRVVEHLLGRARSTSTRSERSRSKTSSTSVDPEQPPPTSAYSAGSFSVISAMPIRWTSTGSMSRPTCQRIERPVSSAPPSIHFSPHRSSGRATGPPARSSARRGSAASAGRMASRVTAASSSRHAASPSQSGGPSIVTKLSSSTGEREVAGDRVDRPARGRCAWGVRPVASALAVALRQPGRAGRGTSAAARRAPPPTPASVR